MNAKSSQNALTSHSKLLAAWPLDIWHLCLLGFVCVSGSMTPSWVVVNAFVAGSGRCSVTTKPRIFDHWESKFSDSKLSLARLQQKIERLRFDRQVELRERGIGRTINADLGRCRYITPTWSCWFLLSAPLCSALRGVWGVVFCQLFLLLLPLTPKFVLQQLLFSISTQSRINELSN